VRWLLLVVLALGIATARAEIVRDPPYDDPTRACWHDTVSGLAWCEDTDYEVIPRARTPMLAAD
jgi:hypothetical protein